MNLSDTICQISTPLGVGAISIIRVSGDDSIDIVNKIFSKNLNNTKSHTISYGFIKDKEEVIDEVLVSVFLSPRTFTTENTVEINCHGGLFVTRKILELLVVNGARLADNGEFTRRAYLNGRIDLTKAESVMDIINSENKTQLELAMKSLSGETKNLVEKLKEPLINVIGTVEVNIDYPEYDDVEILTNENILPKLEHLLEKMNDILDSSKKSLIIKEGLNTLILGKPNVGKSSLLNALLEEEKAIVTNIEGTTRDLVEGKLHIDSLILKLIDSAGIRETDNEIEKIGIERSLKLLDDADLVLLVLDGSRKLEETDKLLLEKTKDKKRIVIINKKDQEQIFTYDENHIHLSTLDKNSLKLLKDEILSQAGILDFDTNKSFISNVRHYSNILSSKKYLEDSIDAVKKNIPLDLVLFDLTKSFEKLDEILGNGKADIVDELFKRFCLGK